MAKPEQTETKEESPSEDAHEKADKEPEPKQETPQPEPKVPKLVTFKGVLKKVGNFRLGAAGDYTLEIYARIMPTEEVKMKHKSSADDDAKEEQKEKKPSEPIGPPPPKKSLDCILSENT